MALSNVIDLLTYKTNLVGGDTYISNLYIPGEYSCITFSSYCDQDLSFIVEFSNDGYNFDILESFNTTASVPFHQSVVILAKWMRYSVTNSSISSSSVLRIYCYGSVNNVTNQSILVNSIAGKLSEINVSNFPISRSGSNETIIYTLEKGYNFQACSNGTTVGTFLSNYDDLILNSSDLVNTIYNQSVPCVSLRFPNLQLNRYVALSSKYMRPMLPGVNYCVNFCASFASTANYRAFIGASNHALSNSVSGGVIYDGLFFGTYNNEICIFYYNGGSLYTVPQSSWNQDRFDGTQNALLNINYEHVNCFSINFSNGFIVFAVQDTDGVYKKCHVLSNSNSTTTRKEYSLLAFISPTATTSSSGNLLSLYEWSLSSTDTKNIQNSLTTKEYPFQNTFKTIVLNVVDNSFKYIHSIKNTIITLFSSGNKKGKIFVKSLTYHLDPATSSFSSKAHILLQFSKNSTLSGASYAKNSSVSHPTGQLAEFDTSATSITTLNQVVNECYESQLSGTIPLDIVLYDEESLSVGITVYDMGVSSNINCIFNYTEEY